MEVFSVILMAFVALVIYLFVGAVIVGATIRGTEHEGDYVACTVLWPMWITSVGLQRVTR